MKRTIGALGLTAACLAASALAGPAPTLKSRMLASHNAARARVGSAPLVWDATLASSAAVWARNLANTNRFIHDPNYRDGENLWRGSKGIFTTDQMVDRWIAESQFFKPGVFPNVSTDGNWTSVGHYTQVVWHSTTRVGCALASNAMTDVLVCRYTPLGNINGRNPLAPGAVIASPLLPSKPPQSAQPVTPATAAAPRVPGSPIVDPMCLASVPWLVDPASSDLRIVGCRAIGLIPAPDAEGWRRYDNPAGGFVQVHQDVQWDPVTRKVAFRLRYNGGGSGTFAYMIMGGPVQRQTLKAGSFSILSK